MEHEHTVDSQPSKYIMKPEQELAKTRNYIIGPRKTTKYHIFRYRT